MKAIVFAAALGAVCASASAQDFSVGITGRTSLSGWDSPTRMLNQDEVQALMIALEESPAPRSEVAHHLEGGRYSIDDLIEATLLDERDGRLHIDFNYIGVRDVETIERIETRYGEALAEAYRAQWPRIAAALDDYPADSVPTDALAFIMVGAFSLDWDGLDYSAQQGWRQAGRGRGNGDVNHFWATYKPAPDSLRAMYWGSHNADVEGYRVTTFGDHYALPRAGFPDLAWNMRAVFDGLDERLTEAVNPLALTNGPLVREAVMKTMVFLRGGPATSGQVAEALQYSQSGADRVLTALQALDYVTLDGEMWSINIPVLLADDAAITAEILAAGRDAMQVWADEHVQNALADMADLTAVRHGVSREAVMTQVWHNIFAIASQSLVADGRLADPYDRPEGLQGFFPAVWHLDNLPAALTGSDQTEY